MSLSLDLGSKPEGLEAKTFDAKTVFIGDYEISMEDFLILAKYVLTNADIEDNDPRLQFVECIREMKAVNGWNPGHLRLESPLSPTRREENPIPF